MHKHAPERNQLNNNGPKSHIPPAPQQPTPDGKFRCGICTKTYSRRDLRDRHRRRCIKTIGQERLSKRKSCETCAQKKLRCSMTRPACTRCLQIGAICQYPYPASVAPVRRENCDPTALPSSLIPASSGLSGTIAPALLGGMSHAQELVDPMANALAETSFPNPDIFPPLSLPSWNEEFSISSQALGQDEEILASLSSNHSARSPSSLRPLSDGGNDPSLPSDGFNQFDVSMSSISSDLSSSLVDFNLDGSAQLVFGQDFIPKTGPLAPYDVQELYQQMFGVLREYPSLILQRDHWSPFVHHRMYRCSMGGMAKPMGVALACVSAHAGSSGSNYGFVDNLINNERQRLVREFQSLLDTPENCVAAVHAVCIYQILGLFGDNFLPAAMKPPTNMKDLQEQRRADCARQAELHNSFLLKMTRRLYKHYRDAIQTTHDNEMNWERWKFSESLRRNIFFANIVNILGARAGRLNGVYFEPLDDEMIFQLSLPAPECMWRACSLREWLEAREYALRMSPVSGCSGSGTARRITQTLQQLLRHEEAGKLDVSCLLPLTRVILASTKIAPGEIGL